MKKLGLALGAGSARGLAHIGVLRALRENDVSVSMICGSSMGSVIGAIHACGGDPDMWAKVVCGMDVRDLIDMTVPRRGFIRGKKIMELLTLLSKNMDFEETIIPFSCVAVDLHTGKLKVFDTGNIATALRCSIAIPGVFEPCEVDEAAYVDGGVRVRVPTKQVRDMGADVVLGVDVGYRGGVGLYEDTSNLMQILMNSFDIMQWEVTKRAADFADLVIAPPVQKFSPNNLDHVEECVQIGYDTAIEAMPSIKALLED